MLPRQYSKGGESAMTILFKRTSALLIGVVLVLLGVVAISHAQSDDEIDSQSQITITPVTYESSVDPGDVVTSKVTISNNTDTPLSLNTSVENIRRTNNEGEVELTTEETPYEIAKWVSVEPKELNLLARGRQDVSYTIRVPSDASPGGHYGAILVGTPPTKVEANGAAVVQRLGSLLLLRVSGTANEDAVISSFRTKTYSGTWEEEVSSDGNTKTLAPREEDFSKERFQRYFKEGPVAFELAIKNNGNVHVKPVGYITIYNIFHKKIVELPLNSQNVYPGSERSLTVIWPKERLWGIYYKAEFVGLYGTEKEKSLTTANSFWAFPLPAAIAIGVGIIFILLIHRRLGQALEVLFGASRVSEPKERPKPVKSELKEEPPKPEKSERKEKKEDKEEKEDKEDKDKDDKEWEKE